MGRAAARRMREPLNAHRSRPWSRRVAALALLLGGCSAGALEADPVDGAPDVEVGPDASVEEVGCTDERVDPGSLSFDGIDDQVGVGAAPALGLTTFTVEAWIRRDGRGQLMNTGVGGLELVPIAGKGRGESDGTNLDCNYALGFWGDLLGADFEDMATGANHPITGTTPVTPGQWHHVAATYDGSTWRLYLDGALDAERRVDATPRGDSIQHFGIGTAFNSTGVAAGRLHGAVDEVRVWNRALAAAEIADGMYRQLDAGDGLVSRWGLGGEGGGVGDSVGGLDGISAGAAPIAQTPGLDEGLPASLVVEGPADGAVVAGAWVDLSVALDDPDAAEEPATAVFHVRKVTPAADFSLVILPDTQNYTVEGRGNEGFYLDQTRWIRDHRADYNIAAVIHNGDIVNNGDQFEYQWTVADEAMRTLEVAEDGLPDGVPYGVAVGNHDQTPNGEAGKTLSFNRWFGVERFAGRAYYGGHYGRTNDESWFTFTAGGLDFVVVNLQFDRSQDPAVLAWARSIFEMHPDSFGILNTHALLDGQGDFVAQGRAIYDALREVDNVQVMTCGHVGAERRRTDVFEDHPIHTMLADYQFLERGGAGRMRIWELSPARDEMTVRTYSPTLDQWETDQNSEFTLPVDLSGARSPFAELAAAEATDGRATARWSGLEPGQTYEWYASVTDCAHTTETAVRTFTTPSSKGRQRGQRATDKRSRAERARQLVHPPIKARGTPVPIED